MKILKQVHFTLLLAFIVIACEKETEDVKTENAPEACITVAEEAMYEGMPVNFSATCSNNTTTYHWDFGDGSTSEDSVISHIYENAGDYTVTLKVGNETTFSNEATKNITIIEQEEIPVFYHSWDITEDEVWEYGIHVISWTFEIIDATVTIMPGAVVKFKEDVGFSITGVNGAIIANGTKTQPIHFTAYSNSPEPGYYYGINIDGADNNKNSFTNCIFEYGGGWYGSGAVVDIDDTEIEFSDNIIRYTKDVGIIIGGGSDIRNFNNNTFIECGGYSLEINGNAVRNFGTNNILDTDDKGIVVTSGASLPEVRWRKLSLPYIVLGTIQVGSETGTTFIIDPGVMLYCGYEFEFGVGTGKKCKVIIEGTETDKITFTSNQENPQKGDWRGFVFSSELDTTSSLKHCVIEYPDFVNTTDAAIKIHNTSLNINNCQINHVDIGFYCTENGYFQSFSGNTITAVQKGLIMHPNRIPTIGNTNTINAPLDVEIIDAFLTTDAVWPPLNYFINTFFYIGTENGCELILQPGTNIEVMNGRAIYVGKYVDKPGGLKAIGTTENPVIFTSENSTPEAGDWEHIQFGPGTKTGSVLDNCILEYAGEMLNKGAVSIENTNQPTIQNTLIRHSADFGIVTNNASPTFSNNTFENNAKADYYEVP